MDRSPPPRDDVLRITHVSVRPAMQAAERRAWTVIDALAARGHACRLVGRRGSVLAERARDAGLPLVEVRRLGRRPSDLRRLRRSLGADACDLVHLHGADAVLTAAVATAGRPRVPWIGGCRSASAFARLVHGHRCDRLLVPARRLRDALVAGGLDADRIDVVPDGVAPGFPRSGDRTRGRASIGVGDAEELVVSIGGLETAGGHDCLLAAVASLAPARPRLRLAIAGAGPMRTALEIRASELGIRDRTTMLGWRTDVPDLLQAADVLVHPARTEARGTAVIEGMLAGAAPVVATGIGWIPELLGPDGDDPPVGHLVAVDDAAGLAEAIDRALAARGTEAERAMLAAARARAEARHTAERLVDGVLATYRRALADRAAG